MQIKLYDCIRAHHCRVLSLLLQLQLLLLSLGDVMRLLLASDMASDRYSVTPISRQAVSARDVTVLLIGE